MSTAATQAVWEGRTAAEWRRAWRLPELSIYPSAGSTNDLLRERALAGAAAGTVIIADFQSAGRGRLGRAWEAPPGCALLCSVLLRPEGGGGEAGGALPLRIGLLIAEAIDACAGVQCRLKWPNDVLVGSHKVAGILCESAPGYVIAGIGINVAQRRDQLPDTDPPATSLALAAGRHVDRAALAGATFDALQPLLSAAHHDLAPADLARYRERDALYGCAVTVDGIPAGLARGVDGRGALLLEDGGAIRPLHAGTVRSDP